MTRTVAAFAGAALNAGVDMSGSSGSTGSAGASVGTGDSGASVGTGLSSTGASVSATGGTLGTGGLHRGLGRHRRLSGNRARGGVALHHGGHGADRHDETEDDGKNFIELVIHASSSSQVSGTAAGQPAASRTAAPLLAVWTASALTLTVAVLFW